MARITAKQIATRAIGRDGALREAKTFLGLREFILFGPDGKKKGSVVLAEPWADVKIIGDLQGLVTRQARREKGYLPYSPARRRAR